MKEIFESINSKTRRGFLVGAGLLCLMAGLPGSALAMHGRPVRKRDAIRPDANKCFRSRGMGIPH